VSDDGHGALQQGRQLLVLQLLVRHVLRQSIILIVNKHNYLTINCICGQLHRRKARSIDQRNIKTPNPSSPLTFSRVYLPLPPPPSLYEEVEGHVFIQCVTGGRGSELRTD
jgi:hypothetical protein